MRWAMATALPMLLASAQPGSAQMSDAEIRRALIRDSLAGYRGNCPCPYNVNRAGKPCGPSSAYSKPGGQSPLCYERDVTPAMVEQYRRRGRR
jgi:hypothetical protein